MEKTISELSEKDYRAFNRESFSSIKYILESPNTYKYYKDKPFTGNAASLLGTCIHHYIQGNRHLVAFNELSKTKKNAEANQEFEKNFRDSAGEDGIIVPKSFEPKLQTIMKNFNDNIHATSLIDGCTFEKAYLFDLHGVPLKGKLDGVGNDYVVEIKSSSQATNAKEFKEEALMRHYDMQAFMYLHAAGLKKHFFIVINTQEPYKVSVYKSSLEFLNSGVDKAYKAAQLYKKYIIDNGLWDPSLEIQEI